MGDSYFNCAASQIPIDSNTPCVGILIVRDQYGAYPHSPTSIWKFLSGPFYLTEPGDYTPYSAIIEEESGDEHNEFMSQIDLINISIKDIRAHKFPGYFANDGSDLAFSWFRRDVWDYLHNTGLELIKGSGFLTELKESVQSLIDINEGMTFEELQAKLKSDEKFDRSYTNSLLRNLSRDIAVMSLFARLLTINPTPWLKKFMEFIPVYAAMQDANLIISPNNYCDQEAWYAFDGKRKFIAFVNDVITKEDKERYGE